MVPWTELLSELAVDAGSKDLRNIDEKMESDAVEDEEVVHLLKDGAFEVGGARLAMEAYVASMTHVYVSGHHVILFTNWYRTLWKRRRECVC